MNLDLLLDWWDCERVQPLWKSIWRFFKNLKTEPSCDLTPPLLEIHRDCKSVLNSNSAAPFTITKLCIQPIKGWINNENVVYTLSKTLYICNKKKVMPLAGKLIHYPVNWNKLVSQKQTGYIFSLMWNSGTIKGHEKGRIFEMWRDKWGKQSWRCGSAV